MFDLQYQRFLIIQITTHVINRMKNLLHENSLTTCVGYRISVSLNTELFMKYTWNVGFSNFDIVLLQILN